VLLVVSDGALGYGGARESLYIFNTDITADATANSLNVDFCKETIFLHELGHSVGLADVFGSGSIMRSGLSLSEKISNNWIYFLDTDIQTIQQQTKPI
jgi:hypothetical protein